jgi:hypothetical protein
MPEWLVACLWGAAGAGAIEASELYGVIKTSKDVPWNLPGEASFKVWLLSVFIRLAIGAFAAAMCAVAGPLGPAGAAAAGIAAPKLLEQLGRDFRMSDTQPVPRRPARSKGGALDAPH